MTIDKEIPIKNIYYMLTYAFKELRHNNYEHIEGEAFEEIYDLFAEILFKGVSYLLKQGLHKEYILCQETLPSLKGKLSLPETIKEKIAQRAHLACEYDNLTANNLFNQIIKASITLLIRQKCLKSERKKRLKKLLFFFDGIEAIELSRVPWSRLQYDRNRRTYQMLHNLCYILWQHELLSTEEGTLKVAQFSEEQIHLLFQRFVLEYYKRHHPESRASARQITWNFCESNSSSWSLLPAMQSDIMLTLGERTLIIDTKYYSKTLQRHFGKTTIHSGNLYQIHTYVMNEDKKQNGKVDGMILYAQTLAQEQPDESFTTPNGNRLMVKTLNLSTDFATIKNYLDNLLAYSV